MEHVVDEEHHRIDDKRDRPPAEDGALAGQFVRRLPLVDGVDAPPRRRVNDQRRVHGRVRSGLDCLDLNRVDALHHDHATDGDRSWPGDQH
eukprot:CAMPEP_0180114714 /NCGR_PEP_ID=MMETSP0985-20121206/37472_1 /TAXON_ID=483367 /ORGANISM="non described non described, Strain CCMP 2436" /LENGTH=90 /DNA_ID=CAMNT_0022053321 /DNA_START=272 /DNA_END=544 /DNA_ORIENTATION=+